jgi:NADPH-dependent 2,4-dienoyl-CoA reductase/sulfur reductase-like enzyme
LGGILNQCIHNGFGLHYFKEELTGPEYAARFIDMLAGSGVNVMLDAMALELTPDRRLLTVSARIGLAEINAGAVMLAMGCRERSRGSIGIPGTRPAGVYTAGAAQRLVNLEGYMPGKRAVILGSGDIGLIMARRLAWEGAKVELVAEIMPYSSGLNRNIVQCLEDNDIPLVFNHTVVEIRGRERVESVVVAAVDPETRALLSGSEREYACDTLLLSVGLIPENELLRAAGAEMDTVTGGAVVDENRQTTLPGIFACGNALHVHDLVDNVSDEAELAGRAAARYVSGIKPRGSPYRAVKPGSGVRYVVPHRVTCDARGAIELFYRVDRVYKPAAAYVKSDGVIIKQRKKRIMTPGEMESIIINASDIRGDISVEIGEAAN